MLRMYDDTGGEESPKLQNKSIVFNAARLPFVATFIVLISGSFVPKYNAGQGSPRVRYERSGSKGLGVRADDVAIVCTGRSFFKTVRCRKVKSVRRLRK